VFSSIIRYHQFYPNKYSAFKYFERYEITSHCFLYTSKLLYYLVLGEIRLIFFINPSVSNVSDKIYENKNIHFYLINAELSRYFYVHVLYCQPTWRRWTNARF